MALKCITSMDKKCLCAARGCKRLSKMSDEDIIKLLDHEK